jgi:hypothetical protein
MSQTGYSKVPNNRAARLFIFSEFVPPTRLIWHYITVHKNTYTLINFQGFCPTYTVIWTPRLFGTLEYSNKLSYCLGNFEENMDLSRIHLAVLSRNSLMPILVPSVLESMSPTNISTNITLKKV